MKPLSLIQTIILLSCLLLTGCTDPDRQNLVGRWELESADKMLQRIRPDAVNQNQDDRRFEQESADDDSAELTSRMQLHFSGNGELSTITRMGSMQPKPKKGTWKMLSFDSPTQMMRVECVLGLQHSEHEIQFVDQDTILLNPPNLAGLNKKLRFTRQ